MPPRLGHTKSRGGCDLCKARKVKCDEGRPSCLACTRRSRKCFYSENSNRAATVQSPRTGAKIAFEDACRAPLAHPQTQLPINPSRDQTLELYLIWHFTTHIGCAFPIGDSQNGERLQLSDTMCQHIFMHPFLLHAFLMLSAQHLILTRSEPQPVSPGAPSVRIPGAFEDVDFSHVQAHYLDQAINGHRAALDVLSTENAEAVYLSSILLSLSVYSGAPALEAEPNTWLSMARAITDVANAAIPYMPTDSSVLKLLNLDVFNHIHETSAFVDEGDANEFPALIHYGDEMMEKSTLQDGEEMETPEDRSACLLALAMVGSIYKAGMRYEAPNRFYKRLLAFGSLVPPRFVWLVQMQRPRALAIIGQFAALTRWEAGWRYDRGTGPGWFSGFAERQIAVLESLLPFHWQWSLDWPRSVVHGTDPRAILQLDAGHMRGGGAVSVAGPAPILSNGPWTGPDVATTWPMYR